MDKVRIILTLITVAIIAVPIVVEVAIYKDNLSELIIPSEINSLITGTGENGSLLETSIEVPQIVSSEYDPISRTVNFAFNFTNPFSFDLTLRSMSANVVCTQHDFPLGKVALATPIQLRGGETALIPVTGTWTEDAVNHFATTHAGEQKISVDLTGMNVDISGITLDLTQRIHVGEIPLT
jgi:hypothetical protein